MDIKSRAGSNVQSLAVTAVLAVVALFSVLVLSPRFSSTDTYASMFQTIDKKKDTVLTLSAASAAASAALTLIPDDTCTPIAERLSEISKDFTFVIAALLLEKYLPTTLGFVFFSLLVPICCALLAYTRFLRPHSPQRHMLSLMSVKVLVFGLALFLATPTSVFITNRIDETYADSIEATVTAAQQATEAIEVASEQTKREDPENPLEFFQQTFQDLTNAADSAINAVSNAVSWVQGLLNSFIEAFAVMMVTSVIIPVLVPIAMYLLFKVLFGQQTIQVLPMSDERALPKHVRRHDS